MRTRIAVIAVGLGIAAMMARGLATHGGTMVEAAGRMSLGALGVSLILSLAYRAINASGWGLVLGALGEPVEPVAGARIWLASEACRWLPGSVWAFGSRALLATRRGLHGPTVAASVVLELAITVASWAILAALGWILGDFRPPPAPQWLVGLATPARLAVAAGVALAGLVVVFRCGPFRRKLRGLLDRLDALRASHLRPRRLIAPFAFFAAMAVFNGLALAPIVWSVPGGPTCPLVTILAANAAAWLAGFFAIFAPGGLVVREACLAALLAPWIGAETAIAVALAWRLVQVVAEIVGFALIATTGLPERMRRGMANG